MTDLDKKISELVPFQLPEYVSEFYPLFVIFVTKYYEWMEKQGNAQEVIQNIILNRDIDTTASSLATRFLTTYAPNLPQNIEANPALLIKHFRDYFAIKGSVASFEFFFKAFFDDTISIKLPGDSLFKTSDGEWYIERTLRVAKYTPASAAQLTSLNTIYSYPSFDPNNLVGKYITQSVTNTGGTVTATALVEKVVQVYDKYDLTLQTNQLRTGTFTTSRVIVGGGELNTTGNAVLAIPILPEQVAAGLYKTSRGQLSSNQKLQDSLYWQNFSYVIRSRVNQETWRSTILNQLHPAGRVVYDEHLVDNTTSVAFVQGFTNSDITTIVKINEVV